MFLKLKHRLKKLGFISIELVILASVMLTAGGYGVVKLGGNATGATKNENGLFNSLFGKEDEQLPDYVVKINSGINTLYDKGEANLGESDIVTINGIDCYVLKKEEGKALLITKDMYNVRFDTGGHNSADVEGHVGTGSYTTYTYDYKYSTLRTWMEDFYRTQLGADSRILPTTVTYYTKDGSDGNLDNYTTGTIADQHVFALDAKEAKQYKSKFNWNYANQMSGRGHGFWTTAGYRDGGYSFAWGVIYRGLFYDYSVVYSIFGARPAFWISLS